ncbi:MULTISPECIES: hypothetical protein [Streptomyces]|uniref:Uncharacterized protein n=1 Tax=Streptomyces sp. 900129855 TaxID=3155129 RepID=A0ABV2ZKX6_9ACTN
MAARLDELGRAVEEVRITCKALLELPDPQPSAPPTPKLPDHPAYQQIMTVFTAVDTPQRARQVCEAMDLEIAPNNIDNTRLKLKRLTERGILVETEQGLFTQPRPARLPRPKARNGHQLTHRLSAPELRRSRCPPPRSPAWTHR